MDKPWHGGLEPPVYRYFVHKFDEKGPKRVRAVVYNKTGDEVGEVVGWYADPDEARKATNMHRRYGHAGAY